MMYVVHPINDMMLVNVALICITKLQMYKQAYLDFHQLQNQDFTTLKVFFGAH